LVAASILTACSGTGLAANRGGDGPVVFTNQNTRDFLTAIVGGQVGVEAGCFVVGGAAVVWPRGTAPTDTGVRLRDGTAVEPGDTVRGGGGYHPADGYTRNDTDAHVLAELRECAGAGGEIAAFNGGGELSVTKAGS